MMKNKPDNRDDNVDRIQRNIDSTVQNIRLAEDMIKVTDDEKTKRDLTEKNERREEALHGLKKEIKDEAIAEQIRQR